MKELSYFSPFTSPPLLDKSLTSPVVLIQINAGLSYLFLQVQK